ncbi:hypothetical protein K2Z83_23090 [Oscillochloris sp. ZM17-4]|uniref:hypothetical protein n=1 Tax=Oscillochloris sp. ZM17-4 TaxID=2866714 RepID=UPI001C73064D|nr:hypothetical protein [Oscillochloris sp. ZM17-4]MBX0330546.1 hypothetical protein [Oscillochloris sp. ZM17-4]
MGQESKDQESQRRPAKESQMSVGIAIGMMLGLALGVALNNLAIGLAIGVGVGAAIGASLDQKRKRSDTANHDERQEDRPS